MSRLGLMTCALAVFGCRNGDFPRGFGTDEEFRREAFTQVDASPVDVLWVIDTSCSMTGEQASLAENFPFFTDWFAEAELSFRIGITTTNIDEEGTDGADGALQGDPRWLDQDTANLDAAFLERALLGIDQGHKDEKGLQASYAALELLTNGPNFGFLRDEANLSVIVVSDEVEFSETGDPGWDTVIAWEEYAAWLDAKKGTPERAALNVIVGVGPEGFDDPAGCGEGAPDAEGVGAERGTGYLEAARATGGTWESICEPDWAEMLTTMGLVSSGLHDRFPLAERPDEDSLEVTVNGQRTGSWLYDPALVSIVFSASSAIPRPGDEIEVTYQIAQ